VLLKALNVADLCTRANYRSRGREWDMVSVKRCTAAGEAMARDDSYVVWFSATNTQPGAR